MEKRHQEKTISQDDPFQLWRLLDHTEFIISRFREQELAKYGITIEQAHVLDILLMNDGSTTLNHIVDITKRQHHSISTLVRRMESQGLLTRVTIPEDRRKFRVYISRKGEELFRNIPRDSINTLFTGLSDEEKRHLREGMARVLLRAYTIMGIPFPTDIPSELNGMLPPEAERQFRPEIGTNTSPEDHPVE